METIVYSKEVEVPFSKNFSLRVVYNKDWDTTHNYRIRMVIYEPYYDKRKKISPTTSEIELNTAFSSKSGAISEIEHASKSIESQLRGNFAPMVTFHPNNPYGNESTSFSKIISYPYVREYVIPDEGLRNCYSLNEYFKRLDIARIKCDKNKSWIPSSFNKEFYHVGVYLAPNRIVHFSGENKKVEICDWPTFIKGHVGELRRQYPVIPFKDYRQIIRQAIWAERAGFRKNEYFLINKNCEHLANMLVYGIDFSQQIYEIYVDNKRTISRLEKEQEITNNLLGTMVTCETMLMEREYLQEIPPKN